MKILGLSLTNYRQYRDLDLSLEGNPNFVVIVGSNGFGKSNLLSAVSWCLYGRESKAGKNYDYEKSIVNFHTVQDLEPGEQCSVVAELRVLLDNEQTAFIRRSQSFVRGQEPEMSAMAEQQFHVQLKQNSNKGLEEVTEPEAWRDRKFPLRLQPYFLFDGERLDSFLRDDKASSVESAIMEIAQVDRLAQIHDRVETVRGDITREASKKSRNAQVDEYQKKFDNAQRNLENAELKLKIEKEQATKVGQDYDEAEKLMERMGDAYVEAQRLKADKENLEKLSAENDAEWEVFARWSVSALTRMLMKPAIEETAALISERRARGTLPPRITSEALAEIVKEGKCICGRHLIAEDGSEVTIKSLMDEILILSGSGRQLHDLNPYVEKFRANIQEDKTRLGDFVIGLRARKEAMDSLERKLPAYKPSLVPTDDPVARYKELQHLNDQASRSLGVAEGEAGARRADRDSARTQLEKALAEHAKSEQALDMITFAESVGDAAKTILREWKEDVRQQVSESLLSEFKTMLPKKDFVSEVWIDEDFVVHVRNTTGDDIVEALSSGERQSLAFAFSFGLNSISGYSLPMIIDTPFGRMGEEMKVGVASSLSLNTAGKDGSSVQQVIILMTDSEYTPEVAAKFNQREPLVLSISNTAGTISKIEAI